MAVTGSGTQADPYIVHSYSEFISKSNTLSNTAYIQFFDNEHPNQVIDCNTYGSEFKWHNFHPAWPSGNGKIYINLNGCTIKNLIIADGEAMFSGMYAGNTQYMVSAVVSNGSIRNVFMGSATSKFCGDYVEFHDVSISINVAGTTTIPFGNDSNIIMDNCALYLVASTLSTHLMKKVNLSDTDIELHVANQNSKNLFPLCSFTDCRIQGKIGGNVRYIEGDYECCVLGVLSSNYGDSNLTQWVNCVIDLDISDMVTTKGTIQMIYSYSTGINTNVICKSHYPTGKNAPSNWHYMTHEDIRNGTYLNNAGFTVVEVVGS